MLGKFKMIGLAIFLIILSGCGGGDSSSGGGSAPTRTVSTVAGTAGVTGSADGPGIGTALFRQPIGITTDGTNLYVTDFNNHTIRKIVIATGAVTTIAGTPQAPGSADGTGAQASFNGPYGITTDGTNLYVADSGNNTIRKIVIATGVVSTFAGTAGAPAGTADGTGPAARFFFPAGITTDKTNTNLYLTDSNNNTIRQIVIATAAVTTIAGTPGTSGFTDGTGAAVRFFSPAGITTDGTNLYVADHGNNTIRQIVIDTAAVTTIAGNPATAGYQDGFGSRSLFNLPAGICTDGAALYVTDSGNNVIRQVVIATQAVSTLAGAPFIHGSTDGSVTVATFYAPFGIVLLGTDLYVADSNNDTIRKIH